MVFLSFDEAFPLVAQESLQNLHELSLTIVMHEIVK